LTGRRHLRLTTTLARCAELAELACRRAVRAGAEQAEASCGLGLSAEAELEESRLKSGSRHFAESLAVHAYWRGGRGAYVVHQLSAAAAELAGRRAAELARSATPDPDFRSLPAPEAVPEVAGLYDPELADPSAELVLEAAGRLLARARAAEPGCKVSGSVSAASSRGALVNSLGVRLASQATSISAGCLAVIRRRGQSGSFYDFDMGRRLADVDIGAVGRSAAAGAAEYLGGRSLPSGALPVVLGPLAASGLIESVVGAASAESIQRRRSYLAGMLGKRIAARGLSVLDDGLYPAGIYSSPVDAEGVPRRPVAVIEDGVLRELLHNSYTAGKAGTRSNGHSTGAGCGPTNLRPRPGARPAAELIAEVRRGLYINSASLAPNPSSGDVSAMVEFGMLIEKGRLAGPVANVSVGGHILKMLADIEAVSSDYRSEPGNVLPTVRIRRVQVSGAG